MRIAVISAVIGAQRYILPELYAYACLIPFVLGLAFFRSNATLRNSFLLIALFLSVDLSGDVYGATSSVIRIPIYFAVLYALIYKSKIDSKKAILCLAATIFGILITLFNLDVFEAYTFRTDVLIAFLIAIVVSQSDSSATQRRLDLNLLGAALLAFLYAEFFNFLFFYEKSDAVYLSFNSTKAFIVFPALFYLFRGRLLVALVHAVVTFAVVSVYGTRMIALAFVIVFLIGLFHTARLRQSLTISFAIFLGLGVLALQYAPTSLDSNRVTNLFAQVVENGFSLPGLRVIDPVRFDENVLFFDRNIGAIAFGSGFGSGLRDNLNIMGDENYGDAAFSRAEFDSGIFHGLHDVWTDVGLRFGLFFVVAVFFLVFKELFVRKSSRKLYAAYLIVLLFCSFYSVAGVLGTAMIALAFRSVASQKVMEKDA